MVQVNTIEQQISASIRADLQIHTPLITMETSKIGQIFQIGLV